MGFEIGFYGIISEPVVGWVAMADAMVACGVRWIQLRMKHGSPAERLAVARAVRARIPVDFHYIVNDHPALALQVGADGVHLGQGDLSLEQAREVLGSTALIGLSTHSPDQVRSACALQPAYIGMGPVFGTTTKLDAEASIGLAGLASMARVATVPAVAIGGISGSRVAAVMDAGVDGFCAVGPVNASREPAAVIRSLLRSL